jgi:hypothetical protein
MESKRRFTILAFPQFFNGDELRLNVVVLPRNQNPLKPAIEQNFPPILDAPPFAEANLAFEAKIISGLNSFPNNHLADDTQPLAVAQPGNAKELFEALGKNLSIKNFNQTNEDLDTNQDSIKLNPAVAQELSVIKYLPVSYRKAFNFTTPRTPNARTDDSYLCAVRNAGPVPGFTRSPDEISWGKVFAFALRQPLLARQLGMIYETSLAIDPAHFPQGGWLYVDLADGSDYLDQQKAVEQDPALIALHECFIKKYAARIPALKPGEPRQVFAPILFPVLFKEQAADPDPPPDGNYDTLFIEAAAYDDGFAKIVHAYQPRSRNLLVEDSDGAHPVKDVGFRLGWDDEQILIWTMRQMMIDDSVKTNPDKRIDAPLGVFGYAIDVRDATNPANPWESLNGVESKADLTIPKDNAPGAEAISIGGFTGELPYQVYPMQLDGDKSKSYWLPMYYADWNGHSMVLPDEEAAEIYRNTDPTLQADAGTEVTGPAKNQLNHLYDASPLNTALRYGRQYEFRIRLRDLSGGGTELDPSITPINETPSNKVKRRFRRYVAPNQLRVQDLPFNSDALNEINELRIRRPKLGYPAAVYTGKYADAVQSLLDASLEMLELDPEEKKTHEAFGIADPDVDRVEITVEVQTLKMDNLLSVSGNDNYIHLYTTRRSFPDVNDEADYEAVLTIPIVYVDCSVLRTGDEMNLIEDLQLPDDIDKITDIVVPTARAIRLTMRAVCEEKDEDSDYYGLLDDANHDMDVRFGQIVQAWLYKASDKETDLLVDAAAAQKLQGIFLQPDPPRVYDGKLKTRLIGKNREKPPDMVQRLAKQLDIESIELTLTAPKGERVQFGCSNRIRHTLSPENSSLTFASKGDLMNHWLCCINLQIDRDWTWDALEDRSFVITRTVRFTHDDVGTETETAEVGDIEIRHTASFEALHDPKRNYTRLIFIDAVEPKNHRLRPAPNEQEPRFPDTIEVSYALETRFKADHAAQRDDDEALEITLPSTATPAQIPEIASAGIALSPYMRNEKYSATGPRQRFLWVEFKEPVRDPADTYFARVLAYAPDQLISNNQPDQLEASEDPALPLDPEYIRVIAPGSSNDLAGLNAMQPMRKATDSDRHYILPLPPGLHADAPEMFGFFTYELRVGHYRDKDTKEMAWCTAQGRFGRPLRATGLQHPAPTLTCSVHRDEEKLYVSAPYAEAVFNGKNVTADPPRTQLWCLLYAQVRQADNKDYRNILLDDRRLDWRVEIEKDRQVNWLRKYDDEQRLTLKKITVNNWKDELSYGKFQHVYQLAELEKLNKDATKYGTVVWSNDEISQLLELYGLSKNSPLSVLVVEILPTITNIYDHFPGIDKQEVLGALHEKLAGTPLPGQGMIKEKLAQAKQSGFEQGPSPLSDKLGQHRILRTSPLTEVPFVC